MGSMLICQTQFACNEDCSSAIPNYFIMGELNPDGWGFDGISMTERNKMEQ